MIAGNYSDSTSLLDYEGEDVWVKCYDREFDWECYIKVLRIQDRYGKHPRMNFYSIGHWVVDDGALEMLTKEEVLEELWYPHWEYICNYKVIQPIEVCTTQELLDIINSCADTPF